MRSPFRSPLWRNGAFVRLWSAATISIFGSLITRMALPFVAILLLGAGALEVAVLRSLDLAATLLVGFVAGAWVDRLRRRPVLIWADLGRAALLATIPLAFVTGVLAFWQLVVVGFLVGILTTFFDSADNAYLPTIVERERLVEANGALAASGSAAEFTAFGISGFLVQAFSAPITIVVNAVSFVVSAALLGSIRAVEPPAPRREDREPVLSEVRAGLRLVVNDAVLRPFALAQMSLAALWGIFGATYLVYAVEDLGLGPAAIGLIAGAGGFGSLLGAIVAERVTRRWGIGRVAVVAMLLAAGGNALVPLAPAGAPFVAALFLVAQQLVADSAITVYDVTETSIRQARVHDRALGRVTASFHVAGVAAQLVATIAGGLFAEAVGLRAATIVAPLGGLLGAWILWTSPARHLVVLPPRAGVPGRDEVADALEAVVEAKADEPVGG